MAEIKERYKDQRTQNLMIAKLYEDTDSNPLAGCLPSLAQIPIFIALYRSILNLANDQELEEPFLWLPSLEGPTLTERLQLPGGRGVQWLTDNWDGSILDGSLTPLLGWHDTLAYLAIPVALTASQFVTQSIMSPTADDPSVRRTQAILKYIPFLIGYFALQVPAGLCLYWLTSNAFATLTTLGIKKYFELNPPKVEWDFLEAEAAQEEGGSSAFQLDLPANIEDAVAEASRNARPPRASRRLAYSTNAPGARSTGAEEGNLTVESLLASSGASDQS